MNQAPESEAPDGAASGALEPVSSQMAIAPTDGVNRGNDAERASERGGANGRPCDDQNSDLCQQWRMAESTEKLEEYSAGQLRWGIAGFAVSVLAALIASAAFVVSWSTGRKQTRAYISVDPHGFSMDEQRADGFKFGMRIQNLGETPADISDIVLTGAQVSGLDGLKPEELGVPIRKSQAFTLGSGQDHFYYAHFSDRENILGALYKKDGHFVIAGTVFYRDVYRRERTTDFFFSATGDVKDPHVIRRLPIGNKAT